MVIEAELRVTLVVDGEFRLRCWGDESVVFDERNGRTQLLAYPTDLLLRELQIGSRTADDLAQLIAGTLRISIAEAIEYVHDTVQSLNEQGLVMLALEE